MNRSRQPNAVFTYRLALGLPEGLSPAIPRTLSMVEASLRLAASAHGVGIGDLHLSRREARIQVAVPPRLTPLEAAGLVRDRAAVWLQKTLPASGTRPEDTTEGVPLALTGVRM